MHFVSQKTETTEPTPSMPPDPFSLHDAMKSPQRQESSIDSKLEKLSSPKSTDSKIAGTSSTDSGASKAHINDMSSKIRLIFNFVPSLHWDMKRSVGVFASTLSQASQKRPLALDDGDVFLNGFVEVAGSTAKLLCHVQARFQPGSSVFKDIQISPLKVSHTKMRTRD